MYAAADKINTSKFVLFMENKCNFKINKSKEIGKLRLQESCFQQITIAITKIPIRLRKNKFCQNFWYDHG